MGVDVWTRRLTGRDRELAALGSFVGEAVVDGAEQGWWARAICAWTNLGGADANVLADYDGLSWAGRYVVQVPVVEDIEPEDMAAVIGAQGGTNIHYYRRGILSRLG